MARPLVERQRPEGPESDIQQERWLTRATARAFAAAISALLIATLVVNRSTEALTTEGTVTGTAITSGTVSLTDDDAGQSLFDLADMGPGRPVVRCIQLVYEGTIAPVDLRLRAESTGPLAAFLDVSVEQGTGGSFETCDGFDASESVYEGTLAELAAADWLELGRILNSDTWQTYRITFSLQDEQAALGQTATADFIWEVTPS